MKSRSKTIILVVLIISLLANVFSFGIIIKNGLLGSRASKDENNELIQKIKIAKEVFILLNCDPKSGSSEKEYRLYEPLWTTPEYCEFTYKNYNGSYEGNRYCKFGTTVFDEIIEMILDGDPKKYEVKVESDGRWGVENEPMVLRIRTKDERGYNNYIDIDCENIEDIFARFQELYKTASK